MTTTEYDKRLREMANLWTNIELDFWSKVNIIDDEDSCWEFKGFTQKREGDEYGIYTLKNNPARRTPGNSSNIRAHRMAFVLANGGEIPNKVRHRCHNPPCCRPSHLLNGTHQQNMDDKNRRYGFVGYDKEDPAAVYHHRDQRGEKNSYAVLTDLVVIEARQRCANGETHEAIAQSVGISRPVITLAIQGKTWSHLDHLASPIIGQVNGAKGNRTNHASGSSTYNAVLTDDIVIAARKQYRIGNISQKSLAESFGVKRSVLSMALCGQTWRHIDEIEPPIRLGR